MNVFEFILGIVVVTTIASIYGMRLKHQRHLKAGSDDDAGLAREVAMLRDRLAVLERIAIEKETSLDREFEKLRDR